MKPVTKAILHLLLFLTGCGVYAPRPAELPLIRSKKDLRLNAGFSLSPGYHGSFAYGLTKWLSVQGAADFGGHSAPFYLQGSAGYFHNFRNNLVLEVYGGYGHGYGNAYKDANPGHLKGNYNIGFVQLNFGKTDLHFLNCDLGISLKTGYMTSAFFDDNYYDRLTSYGYLYDRGLLLEPGAMIRFGWNHFKISVTGSLCNLKKLTNPGIGLPIDFLTLGLGLNLVFHPR